MQIMLSNSILISQMTTYNRAYFKILTWCQVSLWPFGSVVNIVIVKKMILLLLRKHHIDPNFVGCGNPTQLCRRFIKMGSFLNFFVQSVLFVKLTGIDRIFLGFEFDFTLFIYSRSLSDVFGTSTLVNFGDQKIFNIVLYRHIFKSLSFYILIHWTPKIL